MKRFTLAWGIGKLGRLVPVRGWARFCKDERGIGTLEIVLIAAVLILAAILFKDWIMEFLRHLMGTAENKAGTIFD